MPQSQVTDQLKAPRGRETHSHMTTKIQFKLKKKKKQARGYKTFFMLNSAEHEIYPAHKC